MIVTVQNKGIGVENFLNETSFQIAPNPFTDNINVRFPKSITEIQSFTISDVMSKIVK
jgi:hypothetical protein